MCITINSSSGLLCMLVSSFSGDTTLAGKWREGFCVYDNDADDDDDGSGSCLTSSWISQGLAEC